MRTLKRWRAVVAGMLVTSFALMPVTVSAQMQGSTPPSGPPPGLPPLVAGPYAPTQGDRVGAGVLNVVYIPGKAILCGVGTLASAGLMLLTFGSAYHDAVGVFNEGCAGKWVLTPYDVAGKRSPEDY
jgi:hypothetical protein